MSSLLQFLNKIVTINIPFCKNSWKFCKASFWAYIPSND